MRVDKYLALQGLGTRGEVRALLKAGRVCVDGDVVRDAGRAIAPGVDRVALDGVMLVYRESLHIMLNKPAGYLTAAEDARHPTVMALLPPYAAAMGCMPVGRLDLDTEGLLLLTTDGQLAHRLLSPKRDVDKVYEARVDAPFTSADVEAFARGLALSDFTALPALLEPLDDGCLARITVREGKFHQVKRMAAACGKQVRRLRRVSLGGVPLDPALPLGAWRELTAEELATLTREAMGYG